MHILIKFFLSLSAAFVPCVVCLLCGVAVSLPLMGLAGSVGWALLGEFDLRKTKKELRNSYYKKDLEFGIFVIDELNRTAKSKKKELITKLNKIEDIIVDCKTCIKDQDPQSELNKMLGIVNVWAMEIENNPNYNVERFKRGIRSVRSYFVSEKGNV